MVWALHCEELKHKAHRHKGSINVYIPNWTPLLYHSLPIFANSSFICYNKTIQEFKTFKNTFSKMPVEAFKQGKAYKLS